MNKTTYQCLMGVAIGGLLCAGLPAVADTVHIPKDYPTIQDGIDAAVDGDEIVVAPGTYLETINLLGKAIWLHSSDGPEVTMIDAQQAGSVVTCESGEGPDTVLEGFTITNGLAGRGGGMLNDNSSPAVADCTFTENRTSGQENGGGGMANINGSNPIVTSCTFRGNESDYFDGLWWGRGGGMHNELSSPTVTDCTFSGNTALNDGGGMYNDNSSPTVTNSTFSGNQAFWGGGMVNINSSPTVTDCTFSANLSGDVGGMATEGGNLTLTNCTFEGNEAIFGTGAGIGTYGGGHTITNCTFSKNRAYVGGGMIILDSSLTVTNCVLWGNTAVEGESQIHPEGSVTLTVAFTTVQGGWSGTGNINADPLFVDPENGDFRLSPGSPCIDAGDNTAVPPGIDTDLDGNPRFVDDPDTADTGLGEPPIVDMGAYEFQVVCVADIDDSGEVGFTDLLAVLSNWGPCPGCPEDLDDNDDVGFTDLLIVLSNWGPCS